MFRSSVDCHTQRVAPKLRESNPFLFLVTRNVVILRVVMSQLLEIGAAADTYWRSVKEITTIGWLLASPTTYFIAVRGLVVASTAFYPPPWLPVSALEMTTPTCWTSTTPGSSIATGYFGRETP